MWGKKGLIVVDDDDFVYLRTAYWKHTTRLCGNCKIKWNNDRIPSLRLLHKFKLLLKVFKIILILSRSNRRNLPLDNVSRKFVDKSNNEKWRGGTNIPVYIYVMPPDVWRRGKVIVSPFIGPHRSYGLMVRGDKTTAISPPPFGSDFFARFFFLSSFFSFP